MTHATRYPSLSLLLAVITLALLIGTPAASQEPSSLEECTGGRLYYVAFPDTVVNTIDNRFPPRHPEAFTLMIYSPVSQQIRISRSGGAARTYFIEENDVIEVDTREVAVPLVTTPGVAAGQTLMVEAESPIVLYAYLSTHYGCAAFTPAPVEYWGREHFVAAWPGETVWDVSDQGGRTVDLIRKAPAPAEFLVIAAYDSTTVRIEPTDLIIPTARTVRLDAGQAYLVQSVVDTTSLSVGSHDIAGTRILSDKPVGVVSGNTRAGLDTPSVAMSTAGNSYKDLMLEWVHPVESHGAAFVFMPTMDDYRPRPNADPVRENEYVRILPSTDSLTEITVVGIDSVAVTVGGSPATATDVVTDTIPATQSALLYTTNAPAALYHSPKPVVEFIGQTGSSGGFNGDYYTSWGSFLVEATPRERWASFVPFRAPSVQASTKHYLNLVTDTSNRFNVYFTQGTSPRQLFPFNRGVIAGTDLVWGSVSINPGVPYIIEGDSGARFSGYVYGNWGGYELYRPTHSGTRGEYEENTAQMYAFPLASRHCVLKAPNTFDVRTRQECGEMDIEIITTSADPSGLSFVRLVNDPDSTYNARLEFVEPSSPTRFAEVVTPNARLRVVAIDPSRDARAVVQFRDRTAEGEIHRLVFDYEADRVAMTPDEILDFGQVTVNQQSDERLVTIVNPLNKSLVVRWLRLLSMWPSIEPFRIVRTDPDFNWYDDAIDSLVLESGDSLRVWIDITPADENRLYDETSLHVETECGEAALPLRASTEQPCLFVDDLDFSLLRPGESATRTLEVCNRGLGIVTFHDSSTTGGGNLVSWPLAEYTVEREDLDKLRDAELSADECITIDVTFTAPSEPGVYRTTARFWSNTRLCRDTSVWMARVDTTSGVDDPSSIGGLSVVPNPASDELAVGVALTRATEVRITLFDASGRAAASHDAGRLGPGTHRIPLDLTTLPSGIYIVRVGDLTERVVVVR